jgi:hypothetical protein
MSNSLRRGFYSGLIGGMVASLWVFVYAFLSGSFWITMYDITSLEFWFDYSVSQLGLTAIFGGIFGLIYSRFYNGIPGEGVKKGVVFGLIIGVLANIAGQATELLLGWLLTGVQEYFEYGIAWLGGSLKWIFYGIVLGILYERLKL